MTSPSSPADQRAARLAEQLRANLHRRKAQARAIAADQPPQPDAGPRPATDTSQG